MRYLFLLLPCLVLSACNSQKNVDTVPQNPQTITQGTIADWHGGQATVNLLADGKVLSTATVNTQGNFSLPLPDATALSGLGEPAGTFPNFSEGCVNNQQVSDATARLFTIEKLQVKNAQLTKDINSFVVSHATDIDAISLTKNYLIYASKPTKIYGDVTCSSNKLRSTYSFLLEFKQGWNAIQLQQLQLTSTMLNVTTQFSTIPLTGSSTWQVGDIATLTLP